MFVKVHDSQTVSFVNLYQVVRVYNSIDMTHVMLETTNGKHYRIISNHTSAENWLRSIGYPTIRRFGGLLCCMTGRH